MSSVTLLDTTQIDAMSGGTPELLLPILLDFQASGHQSLTRLESALAESRFPDAKDVLHQLKGASGTMGLVVFQQLCAECEAQVVANAVPPRRTELAPLLDSSVEAAHQYLTGTS